MSNFRKFTEFCAGISAFTALMYVFRQYMGYTFEEGLSFKEKLSLFFGTDIQKDMRAYLLLAFLLITAIAVSLIFKRYPEISLFFSALPLLYVIYLFDAGKLYEKPMIYVALSIIQIAGNIFDILYVTRNGRKGCAVFASLIAPALPVLFCLTVIWRLDASGVIPLEELYPFDRELCLYSADYDVSLFTIIAVMYGVILLIALLIRRVYFIPALLSLVPLCFILYKQAVGELGPFDEIVMTAAILCTVTLLFITLFGGNTGAEYGKRAKK